MDDAWRQTGIQAQAMTAFHPIEDSSATADIVVPILIERYRPRRVLDLGCNAGAWVDALASRGVYAAGVDGPGMNADYEHDLNTPLRLGQQFDLVLCLEVGEHIRPENAEVLVASCVHHADMAVIWSAATPGQGGFNHVNEQPLGYWANRFLRLGWMCEPMGHLFPSLPHDYYRKNMVEFAQ